jgi:hypothetical protein
MQEVHYIIYHQVLRLSFVNHFMIILHFIEIKTLNTLILEENALVLWFYGKKNLFIHISY